MTAASHTIDMQALKERLVERANIIQARHDSETAALVKRQVQHHVCQIAFQDGHSTAWHGKYHCMTSITVVSVCREMDCNAYICYNTACYALSY